LLDIALFFPKGSAFLYAMGMPLSPELHYRVCYHNSFREKGFAENLIILNLQYSSMWVRNGFLG
jgi:hypothetical protein